MQDFSFYGNKTFQSAFIQILSPGASLLVSLLWTLHQCWLRTHRVRRRFNT